MKVNFSSETIKARQQWNILKYLRKVCQPRILYSWKKNFNEGAERINQQQPLPIRNVKGSPKGIRKIIPSGDMMDLQERIKNTRISKCMIYTYGCIYIYIWAIYIYVLLII